MLIILSQRIDYESEYEDIPFSIYHFPKRYRNQIKPGDRFIYYQGDRYKRENRYYFGTGIIGKVEPDENGKYYYAEIIEGVPFNKKVPIYNESGGFIESIDYFDVRQKPNPSWQNSIRKISYGAFDAILQRSETNDSILEDLSIIENSKNPIKTIKSLNRKYIGVKPEIRERKIQRLIDRGTSITNSLKSILEPKCQICNWDGFIKNDKSRFIEAHHLNQISSKSPDSLCSDNIILVCPTCHREIHYGKSVEVSDEGEYITITLSNFEARIRKNTVKYLESILKG
jgi:predicted HNH restriction endonuclease|tara:strand:- start:45 stop:899 length:855 start_codon:yes stop_codon:yes gene_type:complete